MVGVVSTGWWVTQTIVGASPKLPNYPLLPGDLIVGREDDTFGKVAPGLGVEGFRLTDEQRAQADLYRPSGRVEASTQHPPKGRAA